MSSTNQGHEYFAAEKQYLNSETLDEKIYWLEEMMRSFKKHKGSEKMLAELKTRLKKFKERAGKEKKRGGGKKGIKKEGYQFVLIGLPNSGKSSLLEVLTNAKPKVTEHGFGTKVPEIGTFEYGGVRAQVVDLPSLGGEGFDYGIMNSADCLLVVVSSFSDYENIWQSAEKFSGKKIWVFNKADLKSEDELRKGMERIKSKKLMGAIVSTKSGLGLDVLKQLMFREMGVVRVYTKEPGESRTETPIVLKIGATVRDVAEKIRNGFSGTVKEARLTGPSGKFPNQKVGLRHVVRDLDVVEFHI